MLKKAVGKVGEPFQWLFFCVVGASDLFISMMMLPPSKGRNRFTTNEKKPLRTSKKIIQWLRNTRSFCL